MAGKLIFHYDVTSLEDCTQGGAETERRPLLDKPTTTSVHLVQNFRANRLNSSLSLSSKSTAKISAHGKRVDSQYLYIIHLAHQVQLQ